MRRNINKRWVLAFDASCCKCRRVADRVAQSSGTKLEVLSLSASEVAEWRTQVFGADAPWKPTLLRIGPAGVRGWVGATMALRLAFLLGPRATRRLLSELSPPTPAPDEHGKSTGIGRGQFLRITGLAGAAAVAAIVLGKAPQAVASERLAAAQKWVEANKDRLPTRYADFASYDMAYRKAIYLEVPAQTRSQLWVEHLDHYVAAHPGLTAEQAEVIKRARELASKESTFAGALTDAMHQQNEELRESAISALGLDDAREVMATLGPVGDMPYGDCNCSCKSPYCVACFGFYGHCCDECYEPSCWCNCLPSTCGNLWIYSCEGTC